MPAAAKNKSSRKPAWWHKVPSDPIFSKPTRMERESQREAVKEFLEHAKNGRGIFEMDENGRFFITDDDE